MRAIIVGWKCEQCGRKRSKKFPIQGHHKIPREQGGEDTIENCELLCRRCHDARHGRPTKIKEGGERHDIQRKLR